MHRLDNDGSLRWIAEPGGSISHLDVVRGGSSSDTPLIVVIHNDSQPGLNSQERWKESSNCARPTAMKYGSGKYRRR
ncbi:MAG: hypothetical protein IPF56_11575 [Chloroflexi bacterium]|nr:hypothetical protein [Chloroflexota bacterium]